MLLQVPAALPAIGPDRGLVVVTASAKTLGYAHFAGVGVSADERERISVIGVEDCDILYPHLMNRSPGPLDVNGVTRELVNRCTDAANRKNAVGGVRLRMRQPAATPAQSAAPAVCRFGIPSA
jgi:hypothetical protein